MPPAQTQPLLKAVPEDWCGGNLGSEGGTHVTICLQNKSQGGSLSTFEDMISTVCLYAETLPIFSLSGIFLYYWSLSMMFPYLRLSSLCSPTSHGQSLLLISLWVSSNCFVLGAFGPPTSYFRGCPKCNCYRRLLG